MNKEEQEAIEKLEQMQKFYNEFFNTGVEISTTLNQKDIRTIIQILNLIQKQESIIKNASYIIKKTNKQFKDFDDTKLNEYLYNFDKCATIKEIKNGIK